jgi:hypothetical protein
VGGGLGYKRQRVVDANRRWHGLSADAYAVCSQAGSREVRLAGTAEIDRLGRRAAAYWSFATDSPGTSASAAMSAWPDRARGIKGGAASTEDGAFAGINRRSAIVCRRSPRRRRYHWRTRSAPLCCWRCAPAALSRRPPLAPRSLDPRRLSGRSEPQIRPKVSVDQPAGRRGDDPVSPRNCGGPRCVPHTSARMTVSSRSAPLTERRSVWDTPQAPTNEGSRSACGGQAPADETSRIAIAHAQPIAL